MAGRPCQPLTLKGKRAALYLRVSTQEQEDGFSLGGQLADCRTYCERQGYRVARIIREVGSGRDPTRPGLLMLTDLAARGAFDVLVIWRRDRFGRDALVNALVDRDLDDAGVRIEAVNTGPDDGSDESRLMTGLLDLVAEYESRKIAGRVKMGLHTAAQTGQWPTRPPYGYKRDKETGRLVVYEPEAARVREAFQECIRGANRNRIALVFGACVAATGKRLRNPAYKGQAVWGGHVVPCPVIVAPEAWEAAQAAIDERFQTKGLPRRRKPYEARSDGLDSDVPEGAALGAT